MHVCVDAADIKKIDTKRDIKRERNVSERDRIRIRIRRRRRRM